VSTSDATPHALSPPNPGRTIRVPPSGAALEAATKPNRRVEWTDDIDSTLEAESYRLETLEERENSTALGEDRKEWENTLLSQHYKPVIAFDKLKLLRPLILRNHKQPWFPPKPRTSRDIVTGGDVPASTQEGLFQASQICAIIVSYRWKKRFLVGWRFDRFRKVFEAVISSTKGNSPIGFLQKELRGLWSQQEKIQEISSLRGIIVDDVKVQSRLFKKSLRSFLLAQLPSFAFPRYHYNDSSLVVALGGVDILESRCRGSWS
jgi:hypothetical protein